MESGPVCKPQNRPRMLICYLCGREYGSRSLPIHIPQCQRKWVMEEENKPKHERRPLPPQPNAEKAIRSGGGPAYDNFNAEAFAAFEQTLTQCPHCQRRFNPKSFHKHQRGCTAAKPAKPAGTGLIQFSLTNRLVPGAVAGSMHGKARSQPIPLRLCRPPPKLKPKLKSKARPVWTDAGGSSFDDMEENLPPVRPKCRPSAQEWCLQAETKFSSVQLAKPKQSSHSRHCVEPQTRNRLPNSRTSSHNGNGGYSGGDKSHLVDTFGDLWRTHKENNLPAVRHNSDARAWCSQPETSLPVRRRSNPRPHNSALSSQSRQSPSSSSQAYAKERILDSTGLAKMLPSGQPGFSESYQKPMHGKTVDGLRNLRRHH